MRLWLRPGGHYLTPRAKDCDIVITNTFAKVNEGEGGSGTGFASVKSTGGDVVLIANAPDGHVSHYLFGTWGSITPNDFRLVIQLPPAGREAHHLQRVQGPHRAGLLRPDATKCSMLDKWDDVLRVLAGEARGRRQGRRVLER